MGSDSPASDAAYIRRHTGDVGRCEPCGKVVFLSRKRARGFAKAWMQGHHMNAYRCPANARHWHLGHLADPVRSGDLIRQECYEAGRTGRAPS